MNKYNPPRKLTRAESLAVTLELWQHLAETGGDDTDKANWEGWKRHGLEHIISDCALCEYTEQNWVEDEDACIPCPYYQYYKQSCTDTLFPWGAASTPEERKPLARICVAEIQEVIAHES